MAISELLSKGYELATNPVFFLAGTAGLTGLLGLVHGVHEGRRFKRKSIRYDCSGEVETVMGIVAGAVTAVNINESVFRNPDVFSGLLIAFPTVLALTGSGFFGKYIGRKITRYSADNPYYYP